MAKHDWVSVLTTWEKINVPNLQSIGFSIHEALGFLIFGPTATQPISNVSITFTVRTENQ